MCEHVFLKRKTFKPIVEDDKLVGCKQQCAICGEWRELRCPCAVAAHHPDGYPVSVCDLPENQEGLEGIEKPDFFQKEGAESKECEHQRITRAGIKVCKLRGGDRSVYVCLGEDHPSCLKENPLFIEFLEEFMIIRLVDFIKGYLNDYIRSVIKTYVAVLSLVGFLRLIGKLPCGSSPNLIMCILVYTLAVGAFIGLGMVLVGAGIAACESYEWANNVELMTVEDLQRLQENVEDLQIARKNREKT